MSRSTHWTAPVATAALALALTACGDSNAGTAVSVGSDRIRTDDLTARVDSALKVSGVKEQVGTDRPKFERQILTLMIDHQLISDAAKKSGASVTDGEINARYQAFIKQAGSEAELVKQGAAAGIPKEELKPWFGDLALMDKIAEKLTASAKVDQVALQKAYEQNFVQVHAAHILVKDKKLADRLLAQVKADPSKFAALAKKYSTDTGSKNSGGDLGTQPPSKFVTPFAAAVSSAKVGSYVLAKTEFGYHVIHLISRKVTKTLAQATPELRNQLLANQRQAAIGSLLASESKKQKVSVNPRFGEWDATKVSVEPVKTGLSSPGKGSDSSAPASPASGG
ncbi:MAG: peptidylprolyl isomerase [Frankiaceae bacterium]